MKRKSFSTHFKEFKKQWQIQIMVIPIVIFFFIFSYMPTLGLANAFLDYQLTDGFFGHGWAGLKYFGELFSDKDFFLSFRNTLGMSVIKFIFTFTSPIILALLLNELPFIRLKRFVQTGSYLPHFLSYVTVATLWMVFLDPRGPINELLLLFGVTSSPVEFLAESKWFWWVGVLIDCWQESGWNAILYLAAISGINPEVYEAASVDGAGRMRRIFQITLPSIMGTIISLFVLNMGNLLNGGPVGSNFNQSYLLGNAFNRESSYVLQNYIVNTGLNQFRFPLAAAANLIMSALSVLLLICANKASKKVLGDGIL